MLHGILSVDITCTDFLPFLYLFYSVEIEKVELPADKCAVTIESFTATAVVASLTIDNAEIVVKAKYKYKQAG